MIAVGMFHIITCTSENSNCWSEERTFITLCRPLVNKISLIVGIFIASNLITVRINELKQPPGPFQWQVFWFLDRIPVRSRVTARDGTSLKIFMLRSHIFFLCSNTVFTKLSHLFMVLLSLQLCSPVFQSQGPCWYFLLSSLSYIWTICILES